MPYTSTYTGEQIDQRLGWAHQHSNESILGGITEDDVNNWDDVINKVDQDDYEADKGLIADALTLKQDKLTAGTNITISADNVISATGGAGGGAWGSITGTLSDQDDLQDALDAKQNTLTPGTGIAISSSGVISATGGTESGYDPGQRVVIKNASQFSSLSANTVYEINKDFTLTGTYTLPANVTFFFAGGSISGGTWSCPGDSDYTAYWRDRSKRPRLVGDVKFNTANYNMTWRCGFANDEIDFEWFNPSHSNSSNSNADLVAALVDQLHDQVLNIGDFYPITKPITINSGSATLQSKNQFQGGYAAFIASCSAGFYITGKLFSAIIMTDGRLNLKGLTILGATGYTNSSRSTPWALYGSRNAHNDNTNVNVTLYDRYFKSYTINSGASGSERPNSANFCGLDLRHGSIELIEDCCFNGFCRGISFDASKTWSSCTPGFINRCFISTCKWGLFVMNVSDFFCTNCKFNSCNSDCADGISGSTGRNLKAQGAWDNSAKRHTDFGGGVYISASSMIQFDACRWEFNYMGLYIDNACSNVSVTGSIFDRHTHSIVTVYNNSDHGISADKFPDRHNPATCGFNFSGNNILRGLGVRNNWDGSNPSFTPGVAYFCVFSRPDTVSGSSWVKDADNLRKCYLSITGNTFEDNVEMSFDGVAADSSSFNPQNLTYEKAIFMFDCTDDGGVRILSTGNDWRASRAEYLAESYNSSASAHKGYVIIDGGNNAYPYFDGASTTFNLTTAYNHSTDQQHNTSIVRMPGGGAVAWGDISGTLAMQTDLMGALNEKVGSNGTVAKIVKVSAMPSNPDPTTMYIVI